MLFYADKQRVLDPEETTARIVEEIRRAAESYSRLQIPPRTAALETHAGLVGAAVALGELHQAIADRMNPRLDEASPALDRLAAAATLLGRCISRSSHLVMSGAWEPSEAAATARLLRSTAVAVAETTIVAGGGPLWARIPEGYAFYSLYPEMYLASTSKALASGRPRSSYTVVGIRSIGTSLAPLVAGALLDRGLKARVETLRPRGHPFDRYVEMGPCLLRRLESDAHRDTGFLIVDEGPGLTCSSFLSVCSALALLGVEEGRVSILSAWRGAPSIYASEEGRRRWREMRVFCSDATEAFDGWRSLLPFVMAALPSSRGSRDGHGNPAPEILDLSYGRWRERLYPSPSRWPVVHRSTERTKLLLSLPSQQILAKFAGLGDHGLQRHDRAVALADAGFGPPVLGVAYGFLLYRFLEEAHPMAVAELSPHLLERMASYYAFIARRYRRPPAPRFEHLAEMVMVNSREALGIDATGFVEAWRGRAETIDALPLALLDAKPQPHEWIRLGTNGAIWKADSADHFRDHTLVGEQSILWDLAGACEEWEMGEQDRARLLGLWERHTGEGRVGDLLDFFRTAYLAFRVAALHYAIHSTDEEDIRQSLQHEQWKYNQRLSSLLVQSRPE